MTVQTSSDVVPVDAEEGRVDPVMPDVIDAITGRRSIRAFLDQPVSMAQVTAVLDAARWAPSGANMQPWDVHVVQGATKARLTRALLDARNAGTAETADYQYYPTTWFEPFAARRVALGVQMYRALGAARSPAARKESWNRNYDFFGAPVGLLFFVDARLETGSWVDCGMFIQNVMLAARAYGLETCPQASLAEYPDAVRSVLGVAADRRLICGISLGHPDPAAPVNAFERSRVPVESFTRVHD